MQTAVIRFGIGCDCLREHWCGHCMQQNKKQRVFEEDPRCPVHGPMTAKDVITAYPEGHTHG
jgi:hypothetical protein